MRRAYIGRALAVAALLLPAAAARAQVVTSGTWNPMVAPTNASGAFWDNASSDGGNCNIGFFLLYAAGGGFGPCGQSKPSQAFVDGNAGRLGTAAGAPNGAFLSHAAYSFAAGTWTVDFLANIAGYGPGNAPPQELWVFTDGLAGPQALFQVYAVGTYPNALTTSFTFTTSSAWYLGALHAYGTSGWDYSSTMMANHGWALFSQNDVGNAPGAADRYYAAFGDVPAGDQDYNDLVVEISSVPEPGGLLLIATGLAGLLLTVKRRT